MKQSSNAFRIINNASAIVGGAFVQRLLSFFAATLIARSLGKEVYGQFSFVFVYVWFFEVLAQCSFDSILVRWISQRKDETPLILGNAILLRCLLIALTVPIALASVWISGYPEGVKAGIFLAVFQLALTLQGVFDSYYRATLQMKYTSSIHVMRASVNLGLVILFFFHRYSMTLYIGAVLISGFFSLFLSAVMTRRFVPIQLKFDKKMSLALLRESAPLLFSTYLTLLYYRIDVYMLSLMKSFTDIGYYSVATRLTESLNVVAAAVVASFFPLLSQAYVQDLGHFKELIRDAFRTLLFLSLPMAIGGTLISKDLITLLFGPEFAASGRTLAIMLWFTFFSSLSIFLVNLLIIVKRQMVDAWVSLGLVLLNTGLNWILIPKFSYEGAAAATVATEILGFCLMTVYLLSHPELGFDLPRKEIAQAVGINLIFAAGIFGLWLWHPLPVILFILTSAILYLGLLMVFGQIRWSQMIRYLVLLKGEPRGS